MSQETFERELARRAEDVAGAAISVDDVRRRAGSIRRRRRAMVTGAVAAAVAVVALGPSLLGDRADESAPDPAGASTSGVSVLHEGVATLPDGRTVELDVDTEQVTSWGRLSDGRFVVAANRPQRLQVLSPDGELADEYSIGATQVVLSAAGDAAAWMEGNGTVWVLASGTADPVELGRVAVDTEHYPILEAVVDAGHVLLSDGVHLTELSAAGPEVVSDDSLQVTDVSPDGALWAVQYPDDAADPQFGCAGLYDPEADAMVARSCDTADLRFSPDGQHLLGMRGDNNMASDVATYDLELREVGRFVPEGKGHVVSRAGWADDDHLLVAEANWKDSTWTLVRRSLDWSQRQVVVPTEAGESPELTEEFRLSE